MLLLCHLSTYWLQKCDYRVEKTIFRIYVCVAIQKPPFPLISLVIGNFCNTPSSSFAKGGDQVAIGLQWFTFQFNACNLLCNTIQFAVQVVFAPAQQAGNYVSITSARTLIAWRSITTLTWNRTLGIQTVPASTAHRVVGEKVSRWNMKSFLANFELCKNCTLAKLETRKIFLPEGTRLNFLSCNTICETKLKMFAMFMFRA